MADIGVKGDAAELVAKQGPPEEGEVVRLTFEQAEELARRFRRLPPYPGRVMGRKDP
jgi:hypothetical protein